MGLLSNPALFPVSRGLLRSYRLRINTLVSTIGQMTLNLMSVASFICKGRVSREAYIAQASFVGVDTLGVALLLTLFSGMVIALQVSKELIKQGGASYVGALVSISILRELAPVLTGFAVIAIAGSAYSSELATMNIQQQIDALKVLHINPTRYLVVPRILAGATMLPLMTILTALAGILGGLVISYLVSDLNPQVYMSSVFQFTRNSDIIGALVKSAVFGFLIVLICTTFGIETKGGAREVGQTTTRSVVWSFIAMAVADFFLSFMLFGGAHI